MQTHTDRMQAYLDREAKTSLYALLERCHAAEAAHLLDQLRAGRLNGLDGERCLIGHIAYYRGSSYEACGLSRPSTWPIESWLWAVKPGDTPRNHAQALMLEGWLVEWIGAHTLESFGERQAALKARAGRDDTQITLL